MTPAEVRKLLDVATYPGYTWRLDVREDAEPLTDGSGNCRRTGRSTMLLSASFEAPNNVTGAMETQRTRKWYISPYATPSEVVQTCLKMVLTSIEHEAREQFKVQGLRPFDPHHDITALLGVAMMPPDSRPA